MVAVLLCSRSTAVAVWCGCCPTDRCAVNHVTVTQVSCETLCHFHGSLCGTKEPSAASSQKLCVCFFAGRNGVSVQGGARRRQGKLTGEELPPSLLPGFPNVPRDYNENTCGTFLRASRQTDNPSAHLQVSVARLKVQLRRNMMKLSPRTYGSRGNAKCRLLGGITFA